MPYGAGITAEGMSSGQAPFVRRREQTTGLTYFANNVNDAQAAESPGDRAIPGISDYTPVYDNPRQSDNAFLPYMSRGRYPYPARDDHAYYINPYTMLGGEGASWEWEHFGYKVPLAMPVLAGDDTSPGRFGGANHPLDGHAGMVAWPERANVYRPPWQAYGDVIDQRTGDVAPDYFSGYGANPLT